MTVKPIDEIAEEANVILHQIPYNKEGEIAASTGDWGDPIVSYEPGSDGYYKTIKERGDCVSFKVANDEQEMRDYFIREAVWEYAHDYELKHRRYFEDSRRQVDEIIALCYQYVDPAKAFNHQPYNDETTIYLDLFEKYQQIARTFQKKHPVAYLKTKDDIDYIVDQLYTDSPYGGMSDVRKSMLSVRERIARLSQNNPELKAGFDQYEKYFKLLNV